MPNMKKEALDYARLGWPVFPCAVNEKFPLTPNGVKDATTTLKQIEEWWSRWPEANIGLHVGAAGMMAVDYDRDVETGKSANIDKVVRDYDLPVTDLVATSPRGGQHEYFTIPPGVRVPPSASKIAPSVDIRSDNSYVLLPPSKTKHGSYKWAGCDPRKDKPAPAPKKLIDAACAGKRERAAEPKKINVRQDQEHNIKSYLEWVERDAKLAIEGQGGNNCLTATAAMGHSFALTPETTNEILWDFYNPKCQPPWGEDEYEEFERTVFSGHKSASSAQGNMTEDYRRLKVKERADATRKLFEANRQEAEAAGDITAEQPNTSRFTVWTIPELKRREPPEWLVDTVIPELGYSIIYGAPGTFKTFIALDLALSIATGIDWYEWAVKKGRVLYCMGEGSFDADKRIEAWRKYNDAEMPVHDFKLIEPAPLLRLNKDTVDFIETANQYGPWDLVVIDTVGRTMPGINDSSAEGARLFSELVSAIRSELGAATLAITHSPKAEPDKLLGSGAFEADADVIFNAAIPNDASRGIRVNFRQMKLKYGELWRENMGFERVKMEDSLALKECTPVRQAEVESALQREMQVKYIIAVLRSNAGRHWPVSGEKGIVEAARALGCSYSANSLRVYLGKDGWCKDHHELGKYWHRPSESWRTPALLPDLDPAYDLAAQEAEAKEKA